MMGGQHTGASTGRPYRGVAGFGLQGPADPESLCSLTPANGRAVLGERQISEQRRECISQQPRDVLYDVDVRLQENLRV